MTDSSIYGCLAGLTRCYSQSAVHTSLQVLIRISLKWKNRRIFAGFIICYQINGKIFLNNSPLEMRPYNFYHVVLTRISPFFSFIASSIAYMILKISIFLIDFLCTFAIYHAWYPSSLHKGMGLQLLNVMLFVIRSNSYILIHVHTSSFSNHAGP